MLGTIPKILFEGIPRTVAGSAVCAPSAAKWQERCGRKAQGGPVWSLRLCAGAKESANRKDRNNEDGLDGLMSHFQEGDFPFRGALGDPGGKRLTDR